MEDPNLVRGPRTCWGLSHLRLGSASVSRVPRDPRPLEPGSFPRPRNRLRRRAIGTGHREGGVTVQVIRHLGPSHARSSAAALRARK